MPGITLTPIPMGTRTSTNLTGEMHAMRTARIADGEREDLVHELLLSGFDQSIRQPAERRWRWLMAAHIVGQNRFALHWNSHVAMLQFALVTRDLAEAVGQLFRLVLVPLGHLFDRLPVGNTGRSNVNAFAPMELAPDLEQLIADTRQSARSSRH